MFDNCTECTTARTDEHFIVALCEDHLLINNELGEAAFIYSGTDGHLTRWSRYQDMQLQHARNKRDGVDMLEMICARPIPCKDCESTDDGGVSLCSFHDTIACGLGLKAVACYAGEFPTKGDDYQEMQYSFALSELEWCEKK